MANEYQLTLDDVHQYVSALPEGAILPHPNHKGDEEGLLGAALRAKYGIPESQNIWDSTNHRWLEIHAPGESVSAGPGEQIYNNPEVRDLGQAYYGYWEQGYFAPGDITKEKFSIFWEKRTGKPL